VGAVILTNSDNGPALPGAFRRRLLEVLFDGKPEAARDLATTVEAIKARIAAERPHLSVPAAAAEADQLAAHYTSPVLGTIDVRRKGRAVFFDVGEWTSEVASRKNEDGTSSFV